MIKMNKNRSELFAMSEGIDIMCSLAIIFKNDNDISSKQIINILSELINSSDFTRDKLKQSKTLDLVIQMAFSKKDKEELGSNLT